MNNATLNSTTINGTPGTIHTAFAGDVNASIITSDYKWLSKTLKTAQQQFVTRPYYTCQVIDDTLAPNAILTAPAQPLQGSAVIAPDGNILAVGLDSSNNVGFWKITDGSNSSLWSSAPTVILENNANNRSSKNHYAIQVSDYIAGTYKIDIYFFGSFNTGFLSIPHYSSLDGGVTWSSSQVVGSTTIPYNTTNNISIAAGKPYQDNNGNIISTVFYIRNESGGSNYAICYQQYPGTGTTYGVEVVWSTRDIDTEDWVIHSLDVAYIKGFWYVVFSGYHLYYESTNQNPSVVNYNLYISKILNFTGNINTDVWSAATEIISALSASSQNLNSFILPQITYRNSANGIYLIFNGTIVTSIVDSNGGNNVVTTTNYYMSQSVDLLNFTYPQPIIFTDGTYFTDTYSNSFVFQNQYAYLAGNGNLWQYIQNNTVADVSLDIVNYEVTDAQQTPSNINLSIGNQNNQWIGASPTKNGYQALTKNKKINLFQGFYNANGIPEVAPKNIFYIDDIQQNITVTNNDFALAARDLYKPLKVLTTKFAYNFDGIKKYIDIFDGTTLGNYNILSGAWTETGNTLQMNSTGTLIFSLYQQSKSNLIISLATNVDAISGAQTYIYLFYIDSNNFIRFVLDGNASNYVWRVEKNVAGTLNTMDNGTFAFPGNGLPIPFMFVKHNYYKWMIYKGDNTNSGQNIGAFSTPTLLSPNIDMTGLFNDVGSVGFGNLNQGGQTIMNFKYLEYDASSNIEELVQSIATKAGVFSYKLPNIFEDYFYTTTNYNGPYTLKNRSMILPVSSVSMKTDQQFDNIEIKFTAKADLTTSASSFNFDFIFRNTGFSNQNENYFVRFSDETASGGTRSVRLYATHLGGQFQLAGTNLVANETDNNVCFDFTQFHTYRIVFFNGYLFVMIDNEVVLGWFDNNVTNIQTIGYIGFRTPSTTQLEVKNVIGVDLWNQIETYSLNPGDDLENSIETLLTTLRVYFFSDNFGRFKVTRLLSTDTSKYTYQNQLVTQVVDNSDKEYVNQVTVIGYNNITATARDNVSISKNGIIREEVINDNKITAYSDALSRAQAELINYNKFNNQYNPTQIINVGSELYDVVTVINTGANSSNVNQVVRNYSQDMQAGGDSVGYWMQIETGTL